MNPADGTVPRSPKLNILINSLPPMCRRENIYPVYLSTTLRDVFALLFVGVY